MSLVPANSVHPKTRSAWHSWLDRHHARPEGVWLISWKKSSGKVRIPYDELVEEALCFGWIDSTAKTVDEHRAMLWFAPRRPRSGWSKSNKVRIERAIAAGRMQPVGLAKIEAAKQDGSWNALDAVDALELPPDLIAALAGHPPARDHFEAFPPSVKRGILDWIRTAKTQPTRAKRICETATLAAMNRRANQWRKP